MAVQFSGTSEYLLTTTTPITAGPLTIACRFNSDIDTAPDALVGIYDSASNDCFSLRVRGDVAGDPVDLQVTAGGSFGSPARTTTGFTAGTWHHAAGVVNSSTSVSAFIDGGSKHTVNPAVGDPGSLDRVAVGAQGNATLSLAFDGAVAEAGIWNIALSDADIIALASGLSPLLVRPSELMFYAPLIRDVIAVKGPVLTATGTTVVDHPRVIYPRRRIVSAVPTVGGGGGLSIPVAMHHYRSMRAA